MVGYMFFNCSSLEVLPDLSKWKIPNVTRMSNIFSNCPSLIIIPDISKWNIKIKSGLLSFSSFSENNINIDNKKPESSLNNDKFSWSDIEEVKEFNLDSENITELKDNNESNINYMDFNEINNNSFSSNENLDLELYYENFYN